MTDKQMNEVLSGVPDAAREFNEKAHGADGLVVVQAELPAVLTEDEWEVVKTALLGLIEECQHGGSTVDESASDRLLAVSEAAKVLLAL